MRVYEMLTLRTADQVILDIRNTLYLPICGACDA